MPPDLSKLERSPLSSKKFIAYLLAELSWKVIIIVMLVTWKEEIVAVGPWAWWVMLTIVLVAGFVEVGFIGGQAWLDKYVRVAKIAATGPERPMPQDGPRDLTEPDDS